MELGQRIRDTGQLVLSPKRTLPTAEAFVREFYTHRDGRTIQSYAGSLFTWRNNRYAVVEDGAIAHQLHRWMHDAVRPTADRKADAVKLTPFDANPTTVKAALDSIRTHVYLPGEITPPWWLDDQEHPPAVEMLPCRSMNLHIPTSRIMPTR